MKTVNLAAKMKFEKIELKIHYKTKTFCWSIFSHFNINVIALRRHNFNYCEFNFAVH